MPRRLPRISIARIYEVDQQPEGYRMLVDRLWPRGMSRESARLDEWARKLAPGTELRRWFGHRSERWVDFREKYLEELKQRPDEVNRVVKLSLRRKLVLLYAARSPDHNHAIVLKELLESRREQHSPDLPLQASSTAVSPP